MNLDVLIPSLFLPDPLVKMFPAPAAPVLSRLVARADSRTDIPATATAWLFERWGIGPPYPVAATLAAFDGLDSPTPYWLFAEPVNMSSQSKNLELFPARFLDLTAPESQQLVDALNLHFSALGLTFYAPTAGRWYVCCPQGEMPDTTPVDSARTGSMLEHLPISHGRINWRAVQNEIQMLFHAHQVNAAREAAAKPLVNGVWFWGGGKAGAAQSPGYDAVMADAPLPVQLARQSGVSVDPCAWPPQSMGKRIVLVVIDSCDALARDLDSTRWVTEIERIEREWFQPIARNLRQGHIDKLSLFSPDGEQTREITITRRQLALRFWRKPGNLRFHA